MINQFYSSIEIPRKKLVFFIAIAVVYPLRVSLTRISVQSNLKTPQSRSREPRGEFLSPRRLANPTKIGKLESSLRRSTEIKPSISIDWVTLAKKSSLFQPIRHAKEYTSLYPNFSLPLAPASGGSRPLYVRSRVVSGSLNPAEPGERSVTGNNSPSGINGRPSHCPDGHSRGS
jgi:hypothetical protein